jgi:hypothetical protein
MIVALPRGTGRPPVGRVLLLVGVAYLATAAATLAPAVAKRTTTTRCTCPSCTGGKCCCGMSAKLCTCGANMAP